MYKKIKLQIKTFLKQIKNIIIRNEHYTIHVLMEILNMKQFHCSLYELQMKE